MAALLVEVLVAVGLSLGSGGGPAIARLLQDPLSIFSDRSPGARPEGALFATKHKKVKALNPAELSLGEGRMPSVPEDALPGTPGDIVPETPAGVLPPEQLLPDAAPDVALGLPIGPFVGGGGGGFVGIGGPPGGSPGGNPGSPPCCTSTNPNDPPVTPSVPEPATWIMLILGFFMVGRSLRSKTRLGAGRSTA